MNTKGIISDASDKIGIGTTTPSAKLKVDSGGTGTVTGFYVLGGVGAAATDRHVQLGISGGVSGSPGLFLYSTANTSGAAYAIQGVRQGLANDAPLAINPDGDNIGIGTTTPSGKLQVTDGSVLFEGTTGAISTTGAGIRMVWYPGKAAFRAGVVTSSQFDDANVGVESSVGGGRNNIGSGEKSTIGGGVGNVASAIGTTIGGGNGNLATDEYSSVGGGQTNQAGDNAGTTSDKSLTTVGGGSGNQATGQYSTVSGGLSNTAAQNQSTIAGGTSNNTSDGGINETIGGGNNNTVSAGGATVGGGSTNTASGTNATVPGGNTNTASGAYSFAAGRQAQANHNGTFVWSDNQGTTFTSTGTDQFLTRAQGGVGIGTTSPRAHFTLTAQATQILSLRLQIQITSASNSAVRVPTKAPPSTLSTSLPAMLGSALPISIQESSPMAPPAIF